MTRFKEGRRIDAAIKGRDPPELQWAHGYCRMRIQYAVRKDHRKTWENRLREVQAAMEQQE